MKRTATPTTPIADNPVTIAGPFDLYEDKYREAGYSDERSDGISGYFDITDANGTTTELWGASFDSKVFAVGIPSGATVAAYVTAAGSIEFAVLITGRGWADDISDMFEDNFDGTPRKFVATTPVAFTSDEACAAARAFMKGAAVDMMAMGINRDRGYTAGGASRDAFKANCACVEAAFKAAFAKA